MIYIKDLIELGFQDYSNWVQQIYSLCVWKSCITCYLKHWTNIVKDRFNVIENDDQWWWWVNFNIKTIEELKVLISIL